MGICGAKQQPDENPNDAPSPSPRKMEQEVEPVTFENKSREQKIQNHVATNNNHNNNHETDKSKECNNTSDNSLKENRNNSSLYNVDTGNIKSIRHSQKQTIVDNDNNQHNITTSQTGTTSNSNDNVANNNDNMARQKPYFILDNPKLQSKLQNITSEDNYNLDLDRQRNLSNMSGAVDNHNIANSMNASLNSNHPPFLDINNRNRYNSNNNFYNSSYNDKHAGRTNPIYHENTTYPTGGSIFGSIVSNPASYDPSKIDNSKNNDNNNDTNNGLLNNLPTSLTPIPTIATSVTAQT